MKALEFGIKLGKALVYPFRQVAVPVNGEDAAASDLFERRRHVNGRGTDSGPEFQYGMRFLAQDEFVQHASLGLRNAPGLSTHGCYHFVNRMHGRSSTAKYNLPVDLNEAAGLFVTEDL